MSGDTAVWVPGTDHAGIATQMMVERQLAAEGKPTRQQMGREAFTERVWEWKQQYGSAITEQMRRLGASVDWSREYFTMDDRLSIAVKEAFVRLWEQGLIYRGAYIVNWDPSIQTAVSDLEVDSEERVGKLYTIRYPLADGSGSITIATTRPETMLGDVAVAVNPTDERYTASHRQTSQAAADRNAKSRSSPTTGPIPSSAPARSRLRPRTTPTTSPSASATNLHSISIMDASAHIKVPGGSLFDGLDRSKPASASLLTSKPPASL